MRKLRTKFPGQCQGGCGEPINVDDMVAYYESNGKEKSNVYHWDCRPMRQVNPTQQQEVKNDESNTTER